MIDPVKKTYNPDAPRTPQTTHVRVTRESAAALGKWQRLLNVRAVADVVDVMLRHFETAQALLVTKGKGVR